MENYIIRGEDLHWISTAMTESSEMIANKDFLCGSLGLPVSISHEIQRKMILGSSSSYGSFNLILSDWLERNVECTLGNLVHILQEMELNYTADKLARKFDKVMVSKTEKNEAIQTALWFDIPERVPFFVGRECEIQCLHTSLMNQRDGVGTNISIISGLGGIGKTALAIEYAWAYYKNVYQNILWVNAETVETLSNSIQGIANKLQLGTRETMKETLVLVYQYFGKNSDKTLFILDNVESYDSIKQYLPLSRPDRNTPYVLATSRAMFWNDRCSIVQLSLLSEEQCVHFFKLYLNLRTDNELILAAKLALILQCFPLAIRQSAAYIKTEYRQIENNISTAIQQYIEKFNSNSVKMLDFQYWNRTGDTYEKTLYSTWIVTLHKIKSINPEAINIMNLVSYFASENIPLSTFNFIPSEESFLRSAFLTAFLAFPGLGLGLGLLGLIGKANTQISNPISALELLQKFSMIVINYNRDTFDISRLVQSVVRARVEDKYSFQVLNQSVLLLQYLLSTKETQMTKYYLRHAECLVEHITAKNLLVKYKNFVEKYHSVQNQFSETLELNNTRAGGSLSSEIVQGLAPPSGLTLKKNVILKKN